MNPLGMNSLWQLGRAQVITAAPWWLSGGISAANCKAAYRAKGASSLAASKVNLANPGTYDLAAYANDPTFDTASGWTFGGDASAQGLRAASLLSKASQDQTIAIRLSGNTEAGVPVGFGANGHPRFGTNPGNSAYCIYINGGNSYYTAGTIAGFTAGMVLVMAGRKIFKDGIQILATIAEGSPNNTTYGFSLSGLGGYWAGVVAAVAYYDTTLTDTQMTALTAAMQAL